MAYIVYGGLDDIKSVPLVDVFFFLVDNSETLQYIDNIINSATFDTFFQKSTQFRSDVVQRDQTALFVDEKLQEALRKLFQTLLLTIVK